MKEFYFLLLVFLCGKANAQFAPQAGMPGSTAIYKDSAIFKSWANSASIVLGQQQINNNTFGLAAVGDQFAALGKAGENGVVSLGDGGTATLSFYAPIFNGPGADFAVFENSFLDSFLELAFVEVSTDGNRYVRFPAVSNTQDTIPLGGFGLLAPTALNNLAGKYRANYGTPFDLEELKDSLGIDINNIQFVRLIDVVGSLNDSFATQDMNGHKINDPWPTPFPSSGFDLDAVGVIHTMANSIDNIGLSLTIQCYPTLVSTVFNITTSKPEYATYIFYNMMGQEVLSLFTDEAQIMIDVSTWSSGQYIVVTKYNDGSILRNRFVKNK